MQLCKLTIWVVWYSCKFLSSSGKPEDHDCSYLLCKCQLKVLCTLLMHFCWKQICCNCLVYTSILVQYTAILKEMFLMITSAYWDGLLPKKMENWEIWHYCLRFGIINHNFSVRPITWNVFMKHPHSPPPFL